MFQVIYWIIRDYKVVSFSLHLQYLVVKPSFEIMFHFDVDFYTSSSKDGLQSILLVSKEFISKPFK